MAAPSAVTPAAQHWYCHELVECGPQAVLRRAPVDTYSGYSSLNVQHLHGHAIRVAGLCG
jgi:hypothetical protein